jgi:hypothetical protein
MGTVYLTHTNDTGKTLKATIERLSDGYFREDDTETFVSAPAFADKDITLTEGSSENLGVYTASVTATAWSDGLYRFRVHDSAQSNKCVAAAMFAVKNGCEVTVGEESAAHDIYHADIQLDIDTSNSRDEYTIIWYRNGIRQTSGITSPTIQVIKRSDGSDLIASTAMSQIASTGLYKYDATTTARQTAGEAYVVVVTASINSATREWSRVIGRDS